MSLAWFYDNLEPLADTLSLVEIERVYCLDLARFAEREWRRLDEIYRSLPGNYRFAQTAMWFGSDEENPPFLWASVEPPGLQVYGVLSLGDWTAWNHAFLTALGDGSLPFRARE